MIACAVKSTAVVRYIGQETRRRQSGSHEVVSSSLISPHNDTVSLADVDVHSSERDWLHLNAVDLDNFHGVIVDAEPVREKRTVIDQSQSVCFVALDFR